MIPSSPLPVAVASPSRRGLLAACSAFLVAGVLPSRPALAHHGFIGLYDFTRPIYLAGSVVHAYIGYPHARLTLRVPDNLKLPRDREWMRALEDAEARQTLSILRVSKRHGAVDVSLSGAMTRRLMDEPGLVAVGDAIEVVVYRRITQDEYHNELHAVLIGFRDGRLLVSSSPAVNGR